MLKDLLDVHINFMLTKKIFFSFLFLTHRRKCDIEPRDRDRDSKSVMEPRDLSSSARLFPNAQIKIR